MKKKFILLGLILISLLYFTSCASLNIPEGDIKDFVSLFDGDKAYSEVNYGKSVIVNKRYEGKLETLTGTHISIAHFDKRDGKYYHSLETIADGSFVGEEATYQFNNQLIVCYAEDEKPTDIYAKKLTDGNLEILEYKYEDVINSVKHFFYSEVSAGFHTGGAYYGDYILNNISKYYKHFSLNEDKTELTFEITISTPTEAKNEIVNSHKFTLNKYGMLLSVNTTAYYIENKQITSTLVTEMTCDYVTNVEKKLDL